MKTIYYNGRVYTGQFPLVQAFAVEGDKFTFAGSDEQALAMWAEGDEKVTINAGQIGPVTQRLYDELTGIQWGRIADTHGWTMKVV